MERIVDKLLIRYNPDEILDYILLKTAAFAKLNARISVITEKKEAVAAAMPEAIPIVVAEGKAEGGTTSQSEDARRAAGITT